MRRLAGKQNVESPDGHYPWGRIKNDDGTGNGTPVNEEAYGDIHQFFEKLMDQAHIVPNGMPDNEYVGNQLFQALGRFVGYKAIDKDANDDFNLYKTPGIYVIHKNPTNAPIDFGSSVIPGFLIVGRVHEGSEAINQFVVTSAGGMMFRRWTGSVWTSWSGREIKAVDIPSWNMDMDATKDVAHGLTLGSGVIGINIISIKAVIFADGLTSIPNRQINCYSSQAVQGGVIWDGTNVTVERLTGGVFDGANYDSTSSNRGILYIEYSI